MDARLWRATLVAALVMAAATPSSASNDELSDADLVSRASAVFNLREAPVDRVLGLHRGHRVIVDAICGDVCPDYMVRIVHYDIPGGPACAQMGADSAMITVPMAITARQENYCIPHVLYVRKLYTDRPYQKSH